VRGACFCFLTMHVCPGFNNITLLNTQNHVEFGGTRLLSRDNGRDWKHVVLKIENLLQLRLCRHRCATRGSMHTHTHPHTHTHTHTHPHTHSRGGPRRASFSPPCEQRAGCCSAAGELMAVEPPYLSSTQSSIDGPSGGGRWREDGVCIKHHSALNVM